MGLFSKLIAIFLVLILSPIFIITSFICLVFQGSPIFFKQERVGYNFRKFKIIKFRTMYRNHGDLITGPNDRRITYIGMILRKTKLDEIPQLLNIIKGEMRFIGPRPEVPEFFEKNNFQFLTKIKPGISDYASIILRDEDKILEKIGGKNPYKKLLPIKIELAGYYCRKKSFFLDFRLVLITIISIIFPKFCSKVFIMPIVSKELPKVKKFLDELLYY